MMRKALFAKSLFAILCAALLLACLSGCQGADRPSMAKTAEGSQSTRQPLTILTGLQNYGAFVDLLKERYPEVELEFISFSGGATSDYMLATMEQGDLPDIFTMTFVPDDDLQKKNLLDLSPYSIVNEYATTTLNSMDVDGSIYLLPSRFVLLGIVYNKTLLEENGWEAPQSFADLKALAPQIQAAGYRVMDLKSYLTGTTLGAFFSLGNTNYFYTPEGAQWKKDFLQGKAKAVGSLEVVTNYFQQWIDEGFITTYYYDHREADVDGDFDNRKYVFQLYSNRMSGNTTDEFGFLPFLSEDGSNNMLVRLVGRYYGLNKELAAPGNEQKLEDALKVFALMATQEGQAALSNGNRYEFASTSINELPEGSPYADVLPLINKGNMVDMVYSGWEDYFVPLVERYGNEWIRGNITAEDFLVGMDTLNQELLAGAGTEKYAVAQEDIPLEDAARLCAIAQGKAANADAALIALPGFHGFSDSGVNLENKWGVHSGFYQGDVTDTILFIFAPSKGSLLTVELTGSEIMALAEAGFTLEGDPTPFDYCLATKGGVALAADKVYTLAISSEELSDKSIFEKATDTGLEPRQAIIDYITELGSISRDTIVWKNEP